MRFVDSNVFVYHLAADPVYGQKAKNIIEKIEAGEESATSTLAIAQVCSYLKWKRNENITPIFLSLLKGLTSLQKIETTMLDFEEARSLQLQFNLPWLMWDDLVIAAQMKRLDIKEIYSNDKDFEKISWIKRIF
ncbi:MAG: type II toxin-antitoxin system VapC family toxin [Candidatus Bathyarchaeia archaeon]